MCLDQGGSSDSAEIKLDSQYNLVVKPRVSAFGFDVDFREKESRLTRLFLACITVGVELPAMY